jgi:hypothetical protein
MMNLIKSVCSTLLLIGTLWCGQQAQAGIIQTTATSTVQSSVMADNGWTNNFGNGEVDFWWFELTQDSWFSASILADIVFGLSLYSGQVQQDPGMLFSNFSDFSGFAGESLTYLTGTDPFTPLSGGSLDKILLKSGMYTLAVGGNDIGFDPVGQYRYQLALQSSALQQVPAPAPAILLALALAGLMLRRR